MTNAGRYLMLSGNERYADIGLLVLRVRTGAFLISQTHDNVFSAARMDEFVKFLVQFKFVMPELLAPLSVYAQFAAGIGFVFGLFTRWLGLITMVNFMVACWMVHWGQDFQGWWPALILVALGLYFWLRGAGLYSIDAVIERRISANIRAH